MLRVCVFSPGNTLMAIAIAACLALFPIACPAQDDDPPQQAGRLSIVNGTVSIQPAGTQDWGQAYLNYPVGAGDRIFTDSDGRAEIQVGRTYVRIGPNSDVTFVDFNSGDVTFGAAQGSLHIRTFGLWDGQSLYIQTPSGTSTVTGPADFRVDVYPDQQSAIFSNYNGDVYVSGANDFGMDTGSGQALELVGTNPVYPQWLQPAGSDDLDNWSEHRDQQIAHAASFRYVSAEAPGVEDLDAYGQWTPATDYGDMWFPSVPVGWAPYRNGHWINRDPWGWTWVEDEPWGYAPFHFGRWMNYRGRWGWVPGPRAEHPVWSPALVVFAGGIQAGGGGVSVWFPLGPGEAYRPWYPCSPRYVDRVNITNIQETRVVHVQKTYVNVVNVTNVTNITYVNRTAGVTAVRHEDFAAGRPVARVAVPIDPHQMAHVQVMARPEVTPTAQAKISAPPARRVPVAVARPVMINAKGLAVAAQPRAKPLPPPVKTAPPPPRLPNRTVVAPPPNVKMTPTARQAMQTAPAPRPGQQPPAAPVAQQPAANRPVQPQPTTHPAGTAPPPSGERPGQLPPNQQKPAPIPAPGPRPPVQPQTPPRPPEQPHPTHQPTQPVRSTEKPVPMPSPAHQPPEHQPPSHPAERPAPEPVPPPRPVEQHPAPQPRPEPPPQVHTVPPPVHAAPPPSQPRPNSEPTPRPPEKQSPQQEKEKKPKEEPKPQS